VANQLGAAGGMLSLSRALGPGGALFSAISGTFATLAKVASDASRTTMQVAGTGQLMGGTPQQTAMLRGMGGAAGLSMEQMSALGQRVGGFNQSARLLEHVQRLRSLNTLEERLIYLRGRQLEELYPLAYLSNRQIGLLQREGEARKGLFDETAIRNAVRFNFEMERLKRHFLDFPTKVGLSVATGLNAIFEGNASRGQFAAAGLFPSAGYLKQQQQAQQKHTDAMNNHAAALSGAARTFGGGLRTQGALPAALKGAVLNQALAGGNFFLGDLVP
jgi:hypothetical protein